MTLKKLKIGDICLTTDYVANGSFASLKENVKYLDNDGYAILVRLTDFTKYWKKSFRYVSKHAYEFLKHSKLYPGDLIISSVGEPGKTFLVPDLGKPMTLGPNSVLIRPDNKILSTQYLKYFIDSDFGQELIKSIVSGTTQRKFNKTSLRNLEIIIPTLEEQQRIVAKLDTAFTEIDRTIKMAKASAEKTETLFQKYLTEIFKGGGDWVEKSIDEITDKTKNVSPNKSPNTQFKYVDVSSVSNKEFVITKTQLLLGKDAPSRAKKNIIRNDIIFATVRPTLRRIAIVPNELDNQVASTGYVVLRTNKSNHFKFLFYFLFSNNFMKIMNRLQRGASYPAVTDMEVKSQRLKVPNYQKQIKIAKKLDALMLSAHSMIKVQNKKIEELDSLKQSILRQALTEKLIKAA